MATFSAFWMLAHAARGGMAPHGPPWIRQWTKSHTLQLEAIQKRAIQIVRNFSRGMPYSSMLFAASQSQRRYLT